MMPASDGVHKTVTVQVRGTEVQARRIAELEALLREALIWCPRTPKHPTSAKRQAVGDGWVDLGNRIEAVLAETAGLTEGPK
jgi:hypothetical protein